MFEQEIITFKSVPMNFDKEKSGIKNNTLRKYESGDDRFDMLLTGMESKDYPLLTIKNSVTGEDFSRTICDVTFWEGWLIITWKI